MSDDNLLGRIEKIDFFAVLPPGFFLLMTGLLVYISFFGQATSVPQSLDDALTKFSHFFNEGKIANGIFILFGTYIVGSIIRAIEVKKAEKIAFMVIKVKAFIYKMLGKNDKYVEICNQLNLAEFPFINELEKALNALQEINELSGINSTKLPNTSQLAGKDDEEKNYALKNIYNYWKDVLCTNNPLAFEYYETFEARARFSAGMIWAGTFGAGLSLLLFIKYPAAITFPMLIVSTWICIAFCFHLQRVREQEAKVLFFLYVAYQQSRS